MRKVNVRRVVLLILVALVLLALPVVAFAQDETLPDNIVDFFSIDGLAGVVGVVASFAIYWLSKLGVEGTARKVVLVVLQGVVAVIVVFVSGLVPAEDLMEYNTVYIALRAFFMAIIGNQAAYRVNEVARVVPYMIYSAGESFEARSKTGATVELLDASAE